MIGFVRKQKRLWMPKHPEGARHLSGSIPRTRPNALHHALDDDHYSISKSEASQKTVKSWCSKHLEPIRPGDNLAHEKQKDTEKYKSATNAHTTSAETKVALQPIVQFVEQKQLEQTGKTTLTIIAHYSTP